MLTGFKDELPGIKEIVALSAFESAKLVVAVVFGDVDAALVVFVYMSMRECKSRLSCDFSLW